MQNIDGIGEIHDINRTVGGMVMVYSNFLNARQTAERLDAGMTTPALHAVKNVANFLHHFTGKLTQIVQRRPYPYERLQVVTVPRR